MCTYFKTETDVAQNLIEDFFLTLNVRGPSIERILSEKKYGGTGLISGKTEALYAELTKRAEAATSSYSATDDFLQYIYSVLMTENHQNIRSRCLVHEFSFTVIFNDINHGYRAAILKKNPLWQLPFYMAVATYFDYEKLRRTMRTAIVSYLLNGLFFRSKLVLY